MAHDLEPGQTQRLNCTPTQIQAVAKIPAEATL
jgi:hypothetical protein